MSLLLTHSMTSFLPSPSVGHAARARFFPLGAVGLLLGLCLLFFAPRPNVPFL